MKSRIVDNAHSALSDLYGMIPEKDRVYADENMRAVQRAIYALGEMIRSMERVENVVFHSNNDLEHSGKVVAELIHANP